MLDQAQALGSDPRVVEGVRVVLDSASHSADRIGAGQRFGAGLIPRVFRSPRWVPIVGWLVILAALSGVAIGIVQLVTGGLSFGAVDTSAELDRMGIASGILFLSASVTLALALPAMIAVHRSDPLWALRTLRAAALIFTALNAFADFATSGLGALRALALGLFTMAVLSHRITTRSAQLARPVDMSPHVGAGST